MTNYTRGADFERRVAKELEDKGYSVVRSAGSHSPADLVAMSYRVERPVCVQCKLDGRLDPDEWNAFYRWALRGGGDAVVAYKMGKRDPTIVYRRIVGVKGGGGPQPWEKWTPMEKGAFR